MSLNGFSKELEGKNFAVFGAAGEIGRAVIEGLSRATNGKVGICPVVRDQYGVTDPVKQLMRRLNPAIKMMGWYPADVSCRAEVGRLAVDIKGNYEVLHGIIYSVGHCSPGGFDAAVCSPLSSIDCVGLRRELEMHVVGLQNVFRYVAPLLASGGSVVVVGSAITRLTDEVCPSWLYAGPYAAAKAAQSELVMWMRRDPLVKERALKIHLLEFGAVDTRFFAGSSHEQPAFLPMERAVEEILAALMSSAHVTKVVSEEQCTI